MRNHLLTLVGVWVIALFLQNVSPMQAQTSTITTSATFGDMISTFPQAVLSTINSVVLQSTNATSAAPLLDSTARKDNVALQMGLWESGRVGAGVKYWLTELTALRVGASTGVNLGLSGSGNFLSSSGGNTPNSPFIHLPVVSPNVILDISLSASIEKHLFPKRILSPFVGFGMGINAYSRNVSVFQSSVQVNSATQSSTQNNQQYLTDTFVSLSANVSAGVEYFVLPALSITGQVTAWGNILGTLRTTVASTQTENSSQNPATNASTSVSPGLSANVGVGISSSLTLSLYFGRNVLGDIVNAFSSGTLFQW